MRKGILGRIGEGVVYSGFGLGLGGCGSVVGDGVEPGVYFGDMNCDVSYTANGVSDWSEQVIDTERHIGSGGVPILDGREVRTGDERTLPGTEGSGGQLRATIDRVTRGASSYSIEASTRVVEQGVRASVEYRESCSQLDENTIACGMRFDIDGRGDGQSVNVSMNCRGDLHRW